MATKVVPSPAGLAQIRALAGKTHRQIADEIATDMRRLVPVDTGQLRAGISVERKDPNTITIWSRRPGGPMGVPVFVEFGTRPHTIEPHGDYPLTFFWAKAGQVVHFMKVNHPGTPAQPYMRPALHRRRRGGRDMRFGRRST